jgi:hypothetical protein
MRRIALVASLAGLIAGGLAAPDHSLAKTRDQHHRAHKTAHRTTTARRAKASTEACRHKRNNGTVIGAVGGGLAGNLLGHHSVGGTLLGAGAGAVAGHEIARHSTGC